MQEYTGSRPSQLCSVGYLIARSRLISPLNTGLELQFAPRILPPHRSRNTPFRRRGRDANDNVHSPSRPLSFSPPSVSQESELMKSEMQIMTAQLGSTASADESPQSDKGERNDIFIFTRVPSRDKRIFTSSAKKSSGRTHFPRGYVTLRSTCECTKTITMYFSLCVTLLNMILSKSSGSPMNAYNVTHSI